jgi:hypothetical protein
MRTVGIQAATRVLINWPCEAHLLILRRSPGGIFRYLPTALPKFDRAIVRQLLRPFSGCALIRTHQIDPARNLPIRPEQIGPVFFHQSVPVRSGLRPCAERI